MPAEITLDAVELDVENLETIPFDPANLPSSYSLPLLRRTGQRRTATIRTVVLENAFLKLTFAIDLGGRMIGILDKRTGIDILPRMSSLEVQEGGCRGVHSTEGWQVVFEGGDRPNALGPVDFQIREAEDEDEPAELCMFELAVGEGLSWHQRVVLAPDRAEFAMELRVLNREFQTWVGAVGWSLGLPDTSFTVRSREELVLTCPSRDAGLWIGCEPGLLRCTDGVPPASGTLLGDAHSEPLPQPLSSAAKARGERDSVGAGEGSPESSRGWRRTTSLWRMGPGADLVLPRETIRSAITVVPFSGLGKVIDASRSGALGLNPEKLSIQSSGPSDQQKVVIKTGSGQVMEAPVNLTAERIYEIQLPGPIIAAALKEQGRDPVLQWELGRPEVAWPGQVQSFIRDAMRQPEGAEARVLAAFENSPPSEDKLTTGLDSPVLGSLARLGLAIRALEAGNRAETDQLLDEALESSATDPLLWWMRSLGNRSDDERPELLNAHYLAPLEPMLRAESFLSAPSQDREPSPLIAPMASAPDHLVEVACLLLVSRRLEDAARWIDESLRHRSVPMLHLLMAWTLIDGPGLRAEAATHLKQALSTPPEPPFPWRMIERIAIARLVSEFPEEQGLSTWHLLASGERRRQPT